MNHNKPIFALIFFVSLTLLISSVFGSSVMWSQTFGGVEEEIAYSLVVTSDGGYALAGWTKSFGAGYNDFWLIKTDANGNIKWNHTYGGINPDRAYSLVETSDRGYALAGSTSSFGAGDNDFWLVKTDLNGTMLWNKVFNEGDIGEDARSLVETSDGGYAIAGTTTSLGRLDQFFLIKTDSDGNEKWRRTYGGSNFESASSLVETFDGGYALAGITNPVGVRDSDCLLIKTDLNGIVQWNQTFGGTGDDNAYCLIETTGGGFALVGSTSSFGAGDSDFWLIKTDIYGNMEWNYTYGGPESEHAQSLVETSDGGYAFAGYTASLGNTDLWLVKTDSNGNIEWNQTYGGAETDRAYSLVETPSGGYALAGWTSSFGAGDSDFWLIKTDNMGNIPENNLTLFWFLVIGIIVLIIKLVYLKKEIKK